MDPILHTFTKGPHTIEVSINTRDDMYNDNVYFTLTYVEKLEGCENYSCVVPEPPTTTTTTTTRTTTTTTTTTTITTTTTKLRCNKIKQSTTTTRTITQGGFPNWKDLFKL